MNADNTIRELVETHLSDNHKVEGVQFIDQLLALTSEVAEIKCTLADGRMLRFQTQDRLICEVPLDRAKTKLRMLCARLGVLCNETGNQDVSLYGGEGMIKKEVLTELSKTVARASGPSPNLATGISLAPPPAAKEWRVRFKNTPSEQEFTITRAER
jgi:hypothetical protein